MIHRRTMGRRTSPVARLALVAALLGTACASTGPWSSDTLARQGRQEKTAEEQAQGRTTLRKVLVGAAVVGLAVTATGAFMGARTESHLRDDIAADRLKPGDFERRDGYGQNWNRVARGGLLVSGLSGIGWFLAWEMDRGGQTLYGPKEDTPADHREPAFPMPGPEAATPSR